MLGDIDDFIRIEIEPYDCIVRFRECGFLFDRQAVTVRIELRYTITLRIVDSITEYRCLVSLFRISYGFFQQFGKSRSMKNVVT